MLFTLLAIPSSLKFYQVLGPRGSGEDAGSGEKGAVPNAGEVLGQPQVFSHWFFFPTSSPFCLLGLTLRCDILAPEFPAHAGGRSGTLHISTDTHTATLGLFQGI